MESHIGDTEIFRRGVTGENLDRDDQRVLQ